MMLAFSISSASVDVNNDLSLYLPTIMHGLPSNYVFFVILVGRDIFLLLLIRVSGNQCSPLEICKKYTMIWNNSVVSVH